MATLGGGWAGAAGGTAPGADAVCGIGFDGFCTAGSGAGSFVGVAACRGWGASGTAAGGSATLVGTLGGAATTGAGA
ncbi:MAG TPA: PE family protein, partial [Mycobacterium sp.]|nr:PE family protein [Mycobacterium sp.]